MNASNVSVLCSILTLLITFIFLPLTLCTWRYYNSYVTYGTGDTVMQAYQLQRGPNSPSRKWRYECQDGEAMTAIGDTSDDFERISTALCKFTFPYKPPAGGNYPYYPSCHVRNMTDSFYCYNAQDSQKTINTFIVGFWFTDFRMYVYRPGNDDVMPYKCCKTPFGYYIDYFSCYYMPTHDQSLEYYDNDRIFIVMCAQGYIMTGIAKKLNPYDAEYHIDWIQCCRVGYGKVEYHQPPVTYAPSGVPSYYSPSSRDRVAPVSKAYQAQYRSSWNVTLDDEDVGEAINGTKESNRRRMLDLFHSLELLPKSLTTSGGKENSLTKLHYEALIKQAQRH